MVMLVGDTVRIYTLFWVSIFAGDETDFYYELQILNETIFTIPDYFYNFSWNFTTAEPLQFLNLRFYTQCEKTDWASFYHYPSETWTLIQDSQIFKKDNFNNLTGKIHFNFDSQQFITDFNISIDYSKETHTSVKLDHNELGYGDASVLNTMLYA